MHSISRSARAGLSTLVGITVLTPGAIHAAGESDSSPSEVLAVVNGEQILSESFERSLSRRHTTAESSDAGAMDIDQLVFKVINDVLLAQEARAMGLNEGPAIAKKVEMYRRDIAKNRLDHEEIKDRAEPLEDEIDAYFNLQYQRVTFRVVTAYDLDEAEELFGRLANGADMSELAKSESVDPYRLRAGLVEDIERIDLQRSVAEVLFSLEPGELGGPVQTDLGWSIVRPESFDLPSAERFSLVEGKIRAVVRMEKARLAERALAAKLQKKFSVEVDQKVVQSIRPDPQPDGRILPTTPDPDAAVVLIDGEVVIDAAQYGRALLSRWKGIRNLQAASASTALVLARLIDDELLMKEALERGYDRLPAVERAVYAYESDLLVSIYLKEVIATEVEVELSDIKQYYEDHKQELHRPPQVRLGQITVKTEDEAHEVTEALRGGANLGWLAKQRSIDGFKQSGGDRGWYVPRAEMPDFNKDLFDAEVGRVLEPFGMPGNWVILVVTDRREQGIYDFDEVSGNLRQKVFAEKFGKNLDQLIKTLRSRSEIEVNSEKLAQLRILGSREDDSHGGDEFGHGQ